MEILQSRNEASILAQCNDPLWILSVRKKEKYREAYTQMISEPLYKEAIIDAYIVDSIVDCYKNHKDTLEAMLNNPEERYIIVHAANPFLIIRAKIDHPKNFSNIISQNDPEVIENIIIGNEGYKIIDNYTE